MITRIINLLAALWLICGAGASSVHAERLPVRIYTSADGLGSGFIDYIMRDSRGFMWFCTRDGLTRFDGARLITYRVGENESAPGISRIIETRGGIYWITTTGGTFRFKANSLSRPGGNREHPVLNAELVLSGRSSIFQDHTGNVWYTSDDVYRLYDRNGKVESEKVSLNIPPDPSGPFHIYQTVEAQDGSFWMNTNAGLVRRLPDARVVLYEDRAEMRAGGTAVAIDGAGNIWAVRGEDLFIIKPPKLDTLVGGVQLTRQPLTPTVTAPLQPQTQIDLPTKEGEILRLAKTSTAVTPKKLLVASDGNIWLTAMDSLLEFDGRAFRTYGAAQGLVGEMREIAEDIAGNLWIGGASGLLRVDRSGLTTFREADGLKSVTVNSINEGSDGSLYFGNGDFYLSKFAAPGFTTLRPGIDVGSKPMWSSRSAFLSSTNEWWILTLTKLYRFAASNLRQPIAIYDSEHGLKADEAFQIYEDSHGDIWLSQRSVKASDCGLYRLKRGESEFYRFGSAENFPQERSASSFEEDRAGNLWFGFYEGGLVRFANNRFEQFMEVSRDAVITDLHIDGGGRLWLATSLSGVKRLDDPTSIKPTFASLTTDEGLSSNNIRTITEDKIGNIYFGSARGINRLALATNRITHISVGDGLAGDFVVDSHCDKNGVLWFATTNGLSRLVPTLETKNTAPSVLLGGLRIAGEDQAVSELGDTEIKIGDLSPTRNNLQIEFFGLDFRPGQVLKYQLLLEGADKSWSEPTEQRSVTYANLKPGSYRFLVRALNADGLTSKTPAIISFRILPPIWWRWWFLTLATLLILSLFYSFYRYRMARLREVNAALAEAKRAEEDLGKAREERLLELGRVRTRIATDLHDDIGASLTQIAILSEVARQQSMQGNGAPLDPLNSIVSVSNELVETMSDIVWAINPAKDNLKDLIQRMRRFTSDLLTAKHIAFTFDVPSFAPEVPLGANARRELFLIFKESLTNIVKHSGANEVGIQFDFASNHLHLRVTDNGEGFDFEKLSSDGYSPGMGGHGVLSIRKRAAEMNGSLNIASTPGQGTTITLSVPLDAATRHAQMATQTDGHNRVQNS
jgi:signal transduction histidine kinase/ligand-binding sensor domain-containing protein